MQTTVSLILSVGGTALILVWARMYWNRHRQPTEQEIEKDRAERYAKQPHKGFNHEPRIVQMEPEPVEVQVDEETFSSPPPPEPEKEPEPEPEPTVEVIPPKPRMVKFDQQQERFRRVVTLRRKGLTIEAVAYEMNTTPRTISRWLHTMKGGEK